MKDFELKRWFRLFCFCNQFKFGSLWFIKETLLMREYPGYDQESTRKAHPGLSVCQKEITSLRDVIPMLLGSSQRRRGALEVQNVMRSEAKKNKTYFQLWRPVQVTPSRFAESKDNPAEVVRNEYKKHLTAEELKALKKKRFGKGRKK